MNSKFQIGIHKNNDHLHVFPRGDFDGNSAWELVHKLNETYRGEKEIIIDTSRLRKVCPFGRTTFECQIDQSRIPRNRFLFTGEKGPILAPEGCRILSAGRPKSCGCDGNCADCHCRQRRKPN